MSKTKQKPMEELLEEALVPEEEQPYKVPENWVWVKSTYVLDIEYGKGLPISNLTPTGYPVYGANGKIGFYKEYTQEEPRVLMTCRGATCGTINVTEPKSFVTSNSLILKPKWDASIKFLEYLFKALDKKVLISGSAQPQITVKAFEKYYIPLPPINEQKRIAEKIERLFAKLDEAKRLIEEVKGSFELRKISIIKKIIDEGKEDAQQRGWKFAAIKNIFGIKGGGTPSKSNESYWNGTIPWISAKDMKTLYIQETKDYITEEGLNNSSAKMVTKGSIAMVVRSGILQHSLPVAYLMTDCTVNQDLKVFNSGDELVNKYFLWYVKANEKYLLNEYSKAGTTVNSIEFEKFKSHIMSIPPREEIEKKIIKIESIVNKENEIKMYVDQILQLENLKHAILHKAFRGELGTNDPTDEHAIDLLKEVLKSK